MNNDQQNIEKKQNQGLAIHDQQIIHHNNMSSQELKNCALAIFNMLASNLYNQQHQQQQQHQEHQQQQQHQHQQQQLQYPGMVNELNLPNGLSTIEIKSSPLYCLRKFYDGIMYSAIYYLSDKYREKYEGPVQTSLQGASFLAGFYTFRAVATIGLMKSIGCLVDVDNDKIMREEDKSLMEACTVVFGSLVALAHTAHTLVSDIEPCKTLIRGNVVNGRLQRE